MGLGRCLQLETRVWPAVVVQPHRLFHCGSGLCPGQKRPPQAVFLLEDAVQPLCGRVFSTVVLLRHAWRKTMVCEPLNVVMRAVLATPIRVVNWIAPFR